MYRYIFRLLSYHRKENRIFFISQCMGVLLLQFVEIFRKDDSFMKHYAVVSSVLVDLIQLLAILILINTVIFIMLSHWYFFRNQLKEFGTFQCAGMSEKEAFKLYLAEMAVIDMLVLVIGMAAGSILANFCYEVLILLFGMRLVLPGVYWSEIRMVLIIVGAADIFSMGWTFFLEICKSRTNKNSRQQVYKKLAAPVLFAAAAGALHFTLIEMLEFAALLFGLWYLDIGIIKLDRWKLHKKEPEGIERVVNALKKEALIRNDGLILTTGTVFTILFVFLITSFLDIQYWDKDVYLQQNPFDLVVVNYESAPALDGLELDAIIEKGDTPVSDKEILLSARDGVYSFFSAADVNAILGTEYKVNPGSFIQVFRTYGGFEKEDFLSSDTIVKKISGKTVTLQKEGEIENVLFGYNHNFADQIIILNQSDFDELQKKGKDILMQEVYLYQFQDWKKTESVVFGMKKVLGEDEAYQDVSSKVEGYRQVREAYLFYLVTVTPILCGLSVFGLLQFQFGVNLQMKLNESEFYRLECLGVDAKENKKMKQKLLLFLYEKPLLIAVCNSAYFCIWFLAVVHGN